MIMKCRECNKKMGLVEFSTYPAAYFIKLIAAEVIPQVIAAIVRELSAGKKGFIDESMAGLANIFKIACPKCKNVDCWDPAAEEKPKKLNPKSDTVVI